MKNNPARKKTVGFWIFLSAIILFIAAMVAAYLLSDRIDSMSIRAQKAIILSVNIMFPAVVLVDYLLGIVSNIREKQTGRLILNSVLAALLIVVIVFVIVITPLFVEHTHEEQTAYNEYQALQEQKDYNAPEVRAAYDAWREADHIATVDSHRQTALYIATMVLWCACRFTRDTARDQETDDEAAAEDVPTSI